MVSARRDLTSSGQFSGNIVCEFEDDLNLRSWIRAGGRISWDMDPALQATTLEKQMGSSGPLFYAASLKGNVVVRLKPSLRTVSSLAIEPLRKYPSFLSTWFSIHLQKPSELTSSSALQTRRK
jgi:hypothetical protein